MQDAIIIVGFIKLCLKPVLDLIQLFGAKMQRKTMLKHFLVVKILNITVATSPWLMIFWFSMVMYGNA